jgi:4-amino-4-deoxy-L-arabinose transferase-like glycosyltransferase
MTLREAVGHGSAQAGRRRLWLAVAALLLFYFLALHSLVGDSPTMDEQNHVARGLAFLRTGDPRLSLEHPPLVNSLSALPLLTMPELRLPTDHASWERREGWYEFADLFLWQYNHDVTRIIFLARLPIVWLTLALALVGYRFAGQLWGKAAALPALVLLLFEPNLLAHGRYATTDMGATMFTFLTTWLLWRLWCSPGRWPWAAWAAAAGAMGLAFGSKLSTLGFAPVWLVLAVLPLYPAGPVSRWRAAALRVMQLAAAGVAALLVVWLIFGLEWGPFAFVSPALEPYNRLAGPMPTFWAGLEQAALLGGGGRMLAFLLGRFAEAGFVGYFPFAFLVKTPLIVILLGAAASILLLRQPDTRRRALFLLVAAVGYYLFLMQSALNIGYRHALPALPYLLVLISGLAAPELRRSGHRWRLPGAALGWGAAGLVIVALWIHPHYLSYFNPAAGGPANGYQVLTDSNVDWGQDLLRLQEWMAANDTPSVKLGWFGTADPNYYGMAHEPLPGLGRDAFFRLWWEPPFDPTAPAPGVYAISASSLWEPPLRVDEKRVYAWFRDRPPDDRVGYSILIYDVP